jgi:hypothetical protein
LFKARDPISRIISWKTNKSATNEDSKDAAHASMACWDLSPTKVWRLWILESVLFGTTKSYLSNRVAWYLPHGDIWWFKMRELVMKQQIVFCKDAVNIMTFKICCCKLLKGQLSIRQGFIVLNL